MKFSAALLVLGALAVRADDDCITSCESTAASSLGCDVSDLADCFCLADFASEAKACLYENSCSSDVSSFYDAYDTACASVSVSSSTVAATTAATTATTAASSATASADCIATCETTAASSLDCDVSDLSSCFCLDDFATAAKNCLYETTGCGKTYVSSFYSSYNSACASVSETTTLATSVTSAATSVATSVATSNGTVTSSVTLSVTSRVASATSSVATATFTGGANMLKDGSLSFGVAAVAIWGGMAALF
ncbi:MAG: hypothetical protein M1834_009444 [Cirrosporium novae-zelandiae]|nr:MAG: hypothetical protein M1834_009444 [Cirrosporium novae-zelandiae]